MGIFRAVYLYLRNCPTTCRISMRPVDVYRIAGLADQHILFFSLPSVFRVNSLIEWRSPCPPRFATARFSTMTVSPAEYRIDHRVALTLTNTGAGRERQIFVDSQRCRSAYRLPAGQPHAPLVENGRSKKVYPLETLLRVDSR